MKFEYDFIKGVSPDNPKNALRIGIVFCLLGVLLGIVADEDSRFFSVVSLIMIAGGVWLIEKARKSNVASMIVQASQGIKSISSREEPVMIFIGLITMIGFGLPPIFIEMNVRTTDKFHFTFWIFAVIGFFFFRYGLKKRQEYNEIGSPLLFLKDISGQIGGVIKGELSINAVPTEKKLEVRLYCEEAYRTRYDNKSKTVSAVLFEARTEPLVSTNTSRKSDISFGIAIPEGFLPSHAKGDRGIIYWHVDLIGEFTSSSGKNLDVVRTWRVPVTGS